MCGVWGLRRLRHAPSTPVRNPAGGHQPGEQAELVEKGDLHVPKSWDDTEPRCHRAVCLGHAGTDRKTAPTS